MTETICPRQLVCHRCKSPSLRLREVRHECAEWDGGLFITKGGTIKAAGEAFFTGGEIQPHLTEIKCLNCAHTWHPRREFTGAMAAGESP
jgi:hypothetical protein